MTSQKLLSLLFWTVIAILSFVMYHKENKKSIIQYEGTRDFDSYISKKLNWIIDPANSKEGHAEFILRLNDSTGRQATELWVTTGELDPEKINPLPTWQKLLNGAHAMIVNSPDEQFTCQSTQTGTLVANICRGCELNEIKKEIKKPGEVIIAECNGAYKRNGLFSYVANAIVVNQQRLDSLYNITKVPYADGINAFWKDNSTKAISNIFKSYRDFFISGQAAGPKPEILVFNAIGTYHGKVPIDYLYSNFFRILDSNYKAGKELPQKIFINLYPKQVAESPNVFYYPLKDGFKFISYNAEIFKVKRNESQWLEITGLSTGIILLILFFNSFSRKGFIKVPDFRGAGDYILATTGYFILGYGFLQLIEKISQVDLLLHQSDSNFLYVVAGILAIPLSFIIPVAKKMAGQR